MVIIGSQYDNVIAAVTAKCAPVGPAADCGWTPQNVGVHLKARGIVYSGPCGQNVQPNTGEAVGTAVAGMASTVVPGASVIASILSIFNAHHVQAVRTEQSTVCEVVNATNQAIPQLDAAVESGQISSQDGIQTMAQLVAQLKSALSSISGAGSSGHPCNAGCCYQAVLDCHAEFAKTFYVDVSPMQTINNPGAVNNLAPASSLQAAIDYLVPPPGSPTVQNSGVGGISLGWIFALGIGILLVWKLAAR